MKVKEFVKKVFGSKDVFDIPKEKLAEERARVKYKVDDLTSEQEAVEAKIERLMIEGRDKSELGRMMNAEQIKALKQEQKVLLERGQRMLQLYRTLNLLHAVHRRRAQWQDSPILTKLMDADQAQLQGVLEDENIQKDLQEGKLDALEDALSRGFKPSVDAADSQTQEILETMDELEALDEDAAVEVAKEKAASVSKDVSEDVQQDSILT